MDTPTSTHVFLKLADGHVTCDQLAWFRVLSGDRQQYVTQLQDGRVLRIFTDPEHPENGRWYMRVDGARVGPIQELTATGYFTAQREAGFRALGLEWMKL